MRELAGRLSVLDRLGLVLVALWIVWASTTSLLNGRLLSPLSPYVVSPVMVILGVGLGRRLVRAHDGWTERGWIAAGAVALVSVFFVWEISHGGAGGGPLGYANANAALVVQIMALTALAALTASPPHHRLLVLALVATAALVLMIGSRAGTAVALMVMAAVVLSLTVRVRHRWWALALGAIALTASGAGIIWLGRLREWPNGAMLAFDEARRRLWADAFALWQSRPIIGAGPDSFQEFSPLALDADTDTAHSSVLQVAAETGTIGVVLFVALMAMGLAVAAQGPARTALIGIAAWTALGVHSFADHLLEFPLIVLTAGIALGWAGSEPSEEFDVSQGEGPVRW